MMERAPQPEDAASLLELLGSAPEDDFDRPLRAEAARAVAAFCRAYHPGQPLSPRYVSLLLGRALVRTGDCEAAQAALHHGIGDAADWEAYLPVLREEDCSPQLMRLFSLNVMRPGRWLTGRGEVMWILDLDRLRLDSAGLELVQAQGLAELARCLAAVWSPSAGRGSLGLRARNARRDRGTSPAAVRDFLGAALTLAGRRRGWREAPEVLCLDPA